VGLLAEEAEPGGALDFLEQGFLAAQGYVPHVLEALTATMASATKAPYHVSRRASASHVAGVISGS